MRQTITVVFTCLFFSLYAQQLKEMKPTLGKWVEHTLEREIEFEKSRQKCKTLWKKVTNQSEYDKLSEAEKEIYEGCGEEFEDYWAVLGPGCSWYCGGGQDTLSASSTLKSLKTTDYSPKNIHDLSYKTAWIEGVPGYGIGESITYHFPPQTPRITEIIVVNGYIKSEQIWKDNSRVKKLKMYLDGNPFAILHLDDSRYEQHFKFDPLGYSDRKDWNILQKKPWWTITFEIMDVYPGDKYDDTAITEIYFDGIDVH
jgi:hypothetical protein